MKHKHAQRIFIDPTPDEQVHPWDDFITLMLVLTILGCAAGGALIIDWMVRG